MEIRRRLQKVLEHEDELYEVKNVCPPCMHKLEGEPQLEYSMMVELDGNNSLKHVLRNWFETDASGRRVIVENIDRETGKELKTPMYLTAEEVNIFQYEVKGRKRPHKVRVSFSY